MADNHMAEALKVRIDAALQPDIPKINFNGMITNLGTGDIMVVLERNNQPVAVLNASYTVAKTLSVMLGNVIAQLEERSGHTIMTTNEIEQLLEKPKEEATLKNAKHKEKSGLTPKS